MTKLGKLGTVCIITDGLKVDSNGNRTYPSKKGYNLGIIQQSSLDKVLAADLFDNHKVITDNPNIRLDILNRDSVKRRLCYDKLTSKVRSNLTALRKCIDYIASQPDQLRLFRIGSDLLPLFDHPQYKTLYDDKLLQLIDVHLASIKKVVTANNIRLATHPDKKAAVLNSDREHVQRNAVSCLEYHYYFMSKLVAPNDRGVINIHCHGKLDHFPLFDQLSEGVRKMISLENDERCLQGSTLNTLAMCEKYNLRYVFDLHHHYAETKRQRVDSDTLKSIIATWKGERPLFHVSDSRDPEATTAATISPHSEYIYNEWVIAYTKELLEVADLEFEIKSKTLGIKSFLKQL